MKIPKMICGNCMKTVQILPVTSDAVLLKCNCGTFDFRQSLFTDEKHLSEDKKFSQKIKSLGWKVFV